MVDIWLFIFLKLVKKHKVELASTASVSVLWSTASRGRHSICLQRRLRSLHGLRHALNMHSVCICAYACTHAAMHTCGNAHMRPCTHPAMHTCTSFTCMQSLLHLFTQSTHPIIASHSDDYATGPVEGFPGAPSLQACMQDLVFDHIIKRRVDLSLITTIDNALVCKFPYNSTCIHFINEAVTKVIQDFFSCTDREESPCTDIFAHCRIFPTLE